MILTKEFKTRLMALKTSGKKGQYNQAWSVLGELGTGAEVSKNFRDESRIPNCFKYELPDGYRIVFQRVEGKTGEFLALFVGTHDEVDHFLNTHKGWIFDPQRHTMKELRWNTAEEEAVNAARSPELQSASIQSRPSVPVFEALSTEQLVNAGLDNEQVQAARSFSDPDSLELLKFLEEIPRGASTFLLAYVTGSRSERSEIEALLAKERELIASISGEHLPAIEACSDTFVQLKDIPEEKRAFEGLPFEDWMLYLHPDQRSLAHKNFVGPARLRGVSGSGKTVVAIHRARALAKKLVEGERNEVVLFLTYNRSLCELVDRLLQRLCSADEYAHIKVWTLGKWCQVFIRFRTGAPAAWNDGVIDKAWVKIVQSHLPKLHQANLCMNISSAEEISSKDADVQFVEEEIDFIYGKFVHSDADAYLSVSRLGRGRRLGPNQRAIIFSIYSDFVDELGRLKQFDARELARIACALLRKGQATKQEYAGVIVDEVQDLSDIELQIVRMLSSNSGELFLVGDGAQQIYRRGQSLKSIGIEVSGRSFVLRKNYRNTAEIMQAAVALKNGEKIGRFDEDPNASQIDVILSARTGEKPALFVCPNQNTEFELVIREIKYLTSRLKVSPSEICCVSRNAYIRDILLKRLEAASVKALHYRADGVDAGDAILVSTLHNVKGHEFRAVFILGVLEGVLPLYSAVEAEEIEREASLLYVAMTRAKELLYLSYSKTDGNGKVQEPSRFLHDMLPTLDILDFTRMATGSGGQ